MSLGITLPITEGIKPLLSFTAPFCLIPQKYWEIRNCKSS